jgi:hypothetical protein
MLVMLLAGGLTGGLALDISARLQPGFMSTNRCSIPH